MTAVNTDGTWAPATVDGIKFVTLEGLKGRLTTHKGRQLMRPTYGVSLGQVLDRRVSVADVRSELSLPLESLSDVREIIISHEDGDVNVRVVTDGQS